MIFSLFQVTHTDDCVQSEDVPYYCPACDLKIKKEIRLKMSREKPARPAKPPKPERPRKIAASKPGRPSKRDDGIKLKISLKHSPAASGSKRAKAPRSQAASSSGRRCEDDPRAGDSDDSMNGRPLIIDEIFPRTVKVGRIRRSSQRLAGSVGLGDRSSLSEEPNVHCLGSAEALTALSLADQSLVDGDHQTHVHMFEEEEDRDRTVVTPAPQDFLWPERRSDSELDTLSADRKLVLEEEGLQEMFERAVVGEEEDGRDEEEMWLAAVEEGNLARLESVDSELRYGRY